MKKGFTLIEMIVAVAIITILSGVVFITSLSSFKNSKVEGFSNEALSLITQLYDIQSSKAMFLDQVTGEGSDPTDTYNVVFEIEDNEVKARLRNKKDIIETSQITNLAFIGDLSVKFNEDNKSEKILNPQNVKLATPYILTFNSKGMVVVSRESQTETLKSLSLTVGINEEKPERIIEISSPPAGNIVLKKVGE